MDFLQHRSEQLADFLRKSIHSGELSNPLPPSRIWCRKLGVGRPNLLRALQILKQEGLLSVSPKGSSLAAGKKVTDSESPMIVRMLYPAGTSRHFNFEFPLFFEQLQMHGIRLSIECCTPERLKQISAKQNDACELFILITMPSVYQKLFLDSQKPCLVFGCVSSEVSLPYLTPDLNGSTRHATLSLLQRGFKRLVLLNVSSKAAGVAKSVETFRRTCEQWSHQPIQANVLLILSDFTSMQAAMKRLMVTMNEPVAFLYMHQFQSACWLHLCFKRES